MNLPTLLAFLMLLSLLASQTGNAQDGFPTTLAYSARLTNSTGTPVTGPQSITFALYPASTGSIALWSETQNVAISNGELSVTLGETTAIPSSVFSRRLFLGIRVGSDAEMTPRPRLNAAPFSIKANSPLVRTVYVPNGGDALAAGTALRNAVARASTELTASIAIQLDAGFYDLGANSLDLPAKLTLRGMGRRQTTVRSTHPTHVIQMGNEGVLSDLTAQNLGPGAAAEADGAAAVRVPDGAQEVRMHDVEIRSDGGTFTTGIRNALWIQAANNVVLRDSEVFANGGASARGILANSSGGTFLKLSNSDATVNGSSPQQIGIHILGFGVSIEDFRATANGAGSNLTGMLLQGVSGNIMGGETTAVSSVTGGNATGVSLLNCGFVRFRNHFAAGYGMGNRLVGLNAIRTSGNSTILSYRSTIEAAGNAPSTIGLSADDISITFTHGDILASSSATTPVRVVGADLTAPALGHRLSMSSSRVEAFHSLPATDIGAAILSLGQNVVLRNTEISATDDGIEGGVAGSATNLANLITVRGGTIGSGRSTIKKHQNLSLTTRQLDANGGPMVIESGGNTLCLATTTQSAFLPNTCPTP